MMDNMKTLNEFQIEYVEAVAGHPASLDEAIEFIEGLDEYEQSKEEDYR